MKIMRSIATAGMLPVCALAVCAWLALQQMAFADYYPGPLQPGQVLGNNGTSAAPAAPISVWGAVAPSGGNFPLYASPSGTGNCQSPGAGACSLATACSFRNQIATFLGAAGPINLADGTYSTAVGGAMCNIQGNSGGSSSQLTSIQGNCTTPTNVVLSIPNNTIGFLVQDGGEAGINCLEMTGGSGSIGIQARQLAIADYSNIYWGAFGANSVHLDVTVNASSNMSGQEYLLGNFNIHWEVDNGSTLVVGGNTNIPSAVSWSQFAAGSNGTNINLLGWTFSGSGVAGSSGPSFSGVGSGRLLTPGGAACNGAFPGGANCQFIQGYQDSAGDLQTAAYPLQNSSITASKIASLPTPTASTLGGIESIASIAHSWIDSISTSGVPHQSQPAFSDLSGSATAAQLPGSGVTTVAGQSCTIGSNCGIATASNKLSADVALNNASNYFDGPSMAQGTTGTWFATGTVTLNDTAGNATFRCKLWDGTTVISSGDLFYIGGSEGVSLTLTGFLASPAGNIRISCRDISSTNGFIKFNTSANSADSAIWAIRIN
jgi:hypothetical protein